VLPFVNRSHNDDDEYFSDGLADELLNVLAKIRGLAVAALTSSFSFKGKQTTIAEVGRALNVAGLTGGGHERHYSTQPTHRHPPNRPRPLDRAVSGTSRSPG
jgi:TolB-like protein